MSKIRISKALITMAILGTIGTHAAQAADQFGCNKMTDPRICQINEKLQEIAPHQVIYEIDSGTTGNIAAEYEWRIGAPDIIHISPTTRRDYDDDELFYLVAHEYGHAVYKHGRLTLEEVANPADRSMDDLPLYLKYKSELAADNSTSREFNHQTEFDADAFAVKVMTAYSMDYVKAMRGVLHQNTASYNHPSRSERVTQAKIVSAKFSEDLSKIGNVPNATPTSMAAMAIKPTLNFKLATVTPKVSTPVVTVANVSSDVERPRIRP